MNLNSPNQRLSRPELLKFGLILAAGILVFFGVLFPLLRDRAIQLTTWPWYSALVIAVLSLAAPAVLRPVHTGWMFIGRILGYINTRIILGIIYLVLFTPVAFLLMLLKKDPMRRAFDAKAISYRIDSRQPKPENLNRPY